MSNESLVKQPEALPAELPLVHLVARNPAEMQAAQGDLKIWLGLKLTELEREIRELNAALNEARTNNWSTSALTNQRNKAVGRETFYFKILTAVEAGFTIIPEFPVDIFAIRVTRSGVRAATGEHSGTWGWPTIPPELPDIAKAGEGEYKNPRQLIHHEEYKHVKDGETTIQRFTIPDSFQDEVVFPLAAARPVVMNATAQAMALKVFDQIGICRPIRNSGVTRKGDPLIIGQILGKRQGWTQKCVSFIIAWHLNLNDL